MILFTTENISIYLDELISSTFTTDPKVAITTGPVDQTLEEGFTLQLNCTAVNDAGSTRPLMIDWVFTPSSQSVQVMTYTAADSELTQTQINDTVTSLLTIDHMTASGAGTYSCHAYNTVFEDAVVESASITIFCRFPLI